MCVNYTRPNIFYKLLSEVKIVKLLMTRTICIGTLHEHKGEYLFYNTLFIKKIKYLVINHNISTVSRVLKVYLSALDKITS